MKTKSFFIFVLACFVAVLAISASAAVSVNYELEQTTDTDTGTLPIYQIVATLVDTETDFRAYEQNITFDNNVIIPVCKKTGEAEEISTSTALQTPLDTYSYSYYDENKKEDVTVTASYPSDGVVWSANGANSTLQTKVYVTPNECPANDVVVFELHFVLADGYTVDDFTDDTFKVDYIRYTSNAYHCYGNSDVSLNDITVTNNVIPESVAPVTITIPVLAGDKVYLQNGTVATVAAEGDYEVPATVGYVAVNTGYTAQNTYYVDGTTATLVHENGVVAKDEYSLRSPDETYEGQDRSGLRFKMEHGTAGRRVKNHKIEEVGFIMTAESNKVIEAEGENYVLDMSMVDRGYAKRGYAYNTSDGTNFAFNTDDDLNYIITGVFYNIPMNNVQTPIVSRPYYRVGDTYIYGEITKTTLYDVASSIKRGAGFNNLTEGQKEYVNTIITLVEGWIDDVENEIIIDISSLYNND